MLNLDKILDKKNVNGYSEETQKRYKDGKEVDEEVIRVYVSNKEPISTLSAKDEIPEKINGIKTDVVEVGEVEAQCFNNIKKKTHKDKHRPAIGGISVGHRKITAGTLGVVLWSERIEKPVILSNNHVLANSNRARIGDPVYQPGPLDYGKNIFKLGLSTVQIGKLSDFVEISENQPNKQDSAIAEVNLDDVKPNFIDRYGKVTGFDLEPKDNMQVKTSGRTEPEFSEGRITDIKATIAVNYNNFKATFTDQLLSTPISESGDSGSCVLTPNNKIVGLLFAGSPHTTVINKIKYPKTAYGLAIKGDL